MTRRVLGAGGDVVETMSTLCIAGPHDIMG